MDFEIFTMFSAHEGGRQFQTFQEWFDLVQVVAPAPHEKRLTSRRQPAVRR
jgi:hypothetical protein